MKCDTLQQWAIRLIGVIDTHKHIHIHIPWLTYRWLLAEIIVKKQPNTHTHAGTHMGKAKHSGVQNIHEQENRVPELDSIELAYFSFIVDSYKLYYGHINRNWTNR